MHVPRQSMHSIPITGIKTSRSGTCIKIRKLPSYCFYVIDPRIWRNSSISCGYDNSFIENDALPLFDLLLRGL